MPQAQGAQSAQPGTANWEAAVQLQSGSMYVRVVCQPKHLQKLTAMAAGGATTAEALEAALSAISAGEHCLDTAKSSSCIVKLSRLCGTSPLTCYARLHGMLAVQMLSGHSLQLKFNCLSCPHDNLIRRALRDSADITLWTGVTAVGSQLRFLLFVRPLLD